MTALKGGLSSTRLSLIAVLLLAATACAQKPVAAVVSPTPSAIPSSSPVPAGSPSPSAIPIPGASGVECVARPTGAPMVLLGQDLYEVDNPVHARLLCRFANTVAHLFTSDTFEYVRPNGAGTQVVLHSIGSGNESVILTLPAPVALLGGPFARAGAWRLDGGAAATAVQATDSAGNPQVQVWLYSDASAHMLYASRLLTAQMRSQAVFVKDGWVWYFEEVPCDNCAGQSQPSGKVFAMQLSAGAETPVAFAPGDEPRDLWPGEFYPNT